MCLNQTDHIISTLDLLPDTTSILLFLFNVVHTDMTDTSFLESLVIRKYKIKKFIVLPVQLMTL